LAEIAAQLDLTEEAVKKSVQRLRQRFRDCLRAEVAQTVATPDQIRRRTPAPARGLVGRPLKV